MTDKPLVDAFKAKWAKTSAEHMDRLVTIFTCCVGDDDNHFISKVRLFKCFDHFLEHELRGMWIGFSYAYTQAAARGAT